eukprot:CAMPEP_0118931162 /NCGR_PEP_ID=MMETSP1169-20130426/7596_1 /TAXON_ID=36882 /ORGANISM="Pyramimonas obovata, Strain CCMP722" /LENGTH=337 /DNA_ID=CAMNT_0006873629 /DNA_START=203 /DNA_END=1216 /DNA_ORIENTATION=+
MVPNPKAAKYVPPSGGGTSFDPSKDVQTYGRFSCVDPLEEPSGISKGQSPINREDISTPLAKLTSHPNFEMACFKSGDLVCNAIERYGGWDSNLGDALIRAKDYLPEAARPFPMTNVMDIGANVGYFGLLAASQGHTVYMFEPMALNRAIVRSSMCMNPEMAERIMLFPYGLGEHATCTLISHKENVGDGHTKCGTEPPELSNGYVDRGKIQVVPLVEVVNEQEKLFFLKIDVEGYELRVMKTARSLLKRGNVAFIYTEVSVVMMGGRENVHEYFELLWDSGFEVHIETTDDTRTRVKSTVINGAIVENKEDVNVLVTETGLHNCFCIHRTWRQLRT